VPHPPQLKGSLSVNTHAPLGQTMNPAAHLASQNWSTHTSLAAHSVPVGQGVAHHRPPLHAFPAEHTVVQLPQ
jgi:hypothetical protein